MQSSTGCKINVTQASGADIEREIGLVGTRQAIEDAKKAIWAKVDSVVSCNSSILPCSANVNQKEKNGGGYGNKRGGKQDNPNYSDYSQPQQQPSYGQPQAAGQPPMNAAAPSQEAGGADPYAIYGGYQNYLAMWYASVAQQQQQAGQGPPGA